MPRKTLVDLAEEGLRQFPPGSAISWELLDRTIRAATKLWQAYRVREIIKTLEARGVLRPDTDRPGMYVMWPNKVNLHDTRL